jgi:hypothetical protein
MPVAVPPSRLEPSRVSANGWPNAWRLVLALRKTVGAVLVGGFAAASIAAWRPEAPTQSQLLREEAVVWVQAHRDAFPTTFTAYASLPSPMRKAIYQELSWPARQALWQEHLDAYLLPDDLLSPIQRRTLHELDKPLTARQKTLIQELRDSVLPRAFQLGLSDGQRRQVAGRLCEMGQVHLGRTKAYQILGNLGPIDSSFTALIRLEAKPPARIMSVAGTTHLTRVALSKFGLYRFTTCYCSISSFCDCGDGSYCVNPHCASQQNGCGCFFLYACDGSECAMG